jgi:hypothetical protein
LQTGAMATHNGSCSPGSNCGLACQYKTPGQKHGRWWWSSSLPDELPSAESIAVAAADMTVRDSAGHSLLTRACEQGRLDWVELLSPQVKECDQQSVDDETVPPPLVACLDAYRSSNDFENVVKMINIIAPLMTNVNIEHREWKGSLLHTALDSLVAMQWRWDRVAKVGKNKITPWLIGISRISECLRAHQAIFGAVACTQYPLPHGFGGDFTEWLSAVRNQLTKDSDCSNARLADSPSLITMLPELTATVDVAHNLNGQQPDHDQIFVVYSRFNPPRESTAYLSWFQFLGVDISDDAALTEYLEPVLKTILSIELTVGEPGGEDEEEEAGWGWGWEEEEAGWG